MFGFLTIRKAIGALLTVLFLLICGGVTAYLTLERFETEQTTRIDNWVLTLQHNAQYELALFFKDAEVLQDFGQDILQDEIIDSVTSYDLEGRVVKHLSMPGAANQAPPDFAATREDRSSFDVSTKETGGLFSDQHRLMVSVPVFSFVNPNQKNLSRAQFSTALVNARNKGALNTVGYVAIDLNLKTLWQGLSDYAWEVALNGIVIFALLTTLVWVITKRMTAPLANLAQLAEDISEGKLDQTFRVQEGSGEANRIASMLNIVLSDLNSQKLKMDVESHLLNMKVAERTAQLSQKNEELNKAIKQVTQAKDQMRQLAYYDSLTSLPNRQLFTEQLDLLLRLARRDKTSIALLFLDLDNFKRINDSLGHNSGDALLREVGARLSSCVRESDLISKYFDSESKIDVSRLGGDEFTVVLNKLESPEIAGVVAKRLIEALQTPMMIEDHEIVITPSIGVAVAPQDADTVADLLKRADTAMYHAKTHGKNNYSFYSSAMKETGVERLKLENELRKAIEGEQLELYYQPQVDAKTGKITGAEALVRWNHPEHGLIMPSRFVPLAEEMGLIVELGAWTLIEACRQCKEFIDQGLTLDKVAVNVSSLQFNPAFIGLVKQVLIETELPPNLLELELTEGVIMTNAKSSIKALHDIKALGCKLSVDDFGTGYSSLSYLSQFPLDELKIDRSFVIDYDKSESNAALVSAIIAMGQGLNLKMVAEGVDCVEQFKFLRKQGIHIIQGYLFSEPLSSDKFAQLLRANPFQDQLADILAA